MGRITVLHTADLHLGSPFRELIPLTGRQRRKDLMQSLARIAELCRQRQTDLLLIAGDLWEEGYVTRPLVDFVADQFRRIPGTRVIIAPGQADYIHEESFYREYPWPENVHIFHSQDISSIWLPHLNARIYGIAWTSPDQPKIPDWHQIADSQGSGCQVLIVAYGNPDTLRIPDDILGLNNLAYVTLGGNHHHKPWSGKVVDPGCPEPLGFSRPGPCGVLHGRIGMASGSLEFVPVASRQFYSLSVSVEGCLSLEEVGDAVKSAIDGTAQGHNLFRIELTGPRPQGNWDVEQIRGTLEHLFWVNLVDRTETSYDIKSLAAEHSKGVVGRYINAVLESRHGDAEIQKRALALGLDALLSGRIAPW